MKNAFALAAIISCFAAAAFAQSQPVQCTTYPNGQVICVPIGGQPSSFGK